MSWNDGIKNAKIDSTTLGTQDTGMFMFWIGLEYGSLHQSFGGIGLDNPPEERKPGAKRQPTAYGMDCIVRILETVGVESLEQLKGKYVRADVQDGTVKGLINILDDSKTFYPQKLYEEKYKVSEAVNR